MKLELILNKEEVKAEEKLNGLLNTIEVLLTEEITNKKTIRTSDEDPDVIRTKFYYKTINNNNFNNDKIIKTHIKDDFFIDCIEMIGSVVPLIKSIATTLTAKITKIIDRWNDPYYKYKYLSDNNYLVKIYAIGYNVYEIKCFTNELDLNSFIKYVLNRDDLKLIEIVDLADNKNITTEIVLKLEI